MHASRFLSESCSVCDMVKMELVHFYLCCRRFCAIISVVQIEGQRFAENMCRCHNNVLFIESENSAINDQTALVEQQPAQCTQYCVSQQQQTRPDVHILLLL